MEQLLLEAARQIPAFAALVALVMAGMKFLTICLTMAKVEMHK